MARVDVSGVDEVMTMFKELADQQKVNEAAVKAVNKATPALTREMSAAIASREYGPYATGSVSRSVRATRAKTNAYGVFSVAKPTGVDEKGTRNAEKAAYLQYGTPNMAARPWAETAVRMGEEKAAPILEDTFLDEMGIQKGDGE